MLKIQYCSDLHLEFPGNERMLRQNPIEPVADVLVLAGDIVPFAVMDRFDWFFDELSAKFKEVYWIPGNHEYYGSDILDRSGSFCEQIRSNVHLLNNWHIIVDDIRLVFTTLWSHIPPRRQWLVGHRLSDFETIKLAGQKFTPDDFNTLHRDSMAFLESVLKEENPQEKVIVVSHHVPTLYCYPQRFKGDELNSGFAVELFGFIESTQPHFWIFGHHHSNVAPFEIGRTQLLTNQLGYVGYGETEGFSVKQSLSL